LNNPFLSLIPGSNGPDPFDLPGAIKWGAKELGMDNPLDLGTVISYETAGTFDPWKKGPTTKWGTHRGLIQWGEPQAAQYGVGENTTPLDQVKATVKYLNDRGWQPGMSREDLYSIINAGSPGRPFASDRPGHTVRSHVEGMGGHEKRARSFLGLDADLPSQDVAAMSEPMRLGSSENPFLKLVPKKQGQEIPQGVAREVPASEMPEVAAQEPPMSWEDWGRDNMNTLTSGTIGMVTGLAGLPGEAVKAGEWLETKLGMNDHNRTLSSLITEKPMEDDWSGVVPDIEGVDKWVRGTIGDYDYDPKSATGKAVQSVLPYTLAAGKLGAAKGWLPNAGNAANVAKVYAGGKVGQAVGGDAGEIIGAAVMGGRTGMPKTPKGHKDTSAAFREGTKQYGVPEKLGVNVGGRQFYGFTQSLKRDKDIQDLLKQPNLEGSLPNAVAGLLNAVSRPQPTRVGNVTTLNFQDMSVKDFDRWRRSISKFLGKEDANVRRQAHIVINKMDEFFGKDGNFTGAPENIAKARASLPKAREAWRRGMQSKRLDSFNRLAENRAAGLTGSGRDNAIRLEYKKLIDRIDRSDVEKKKWSKDEISAIRKIARIGWGPRRALRTVGRFNPMGLGGFGYAGYGGLTGDWESAGLAGGLTLGSRALAGSLAARRARQLQNLTLAGGKKVSDPNQILRGAMGGYLGGQ
jgi:hypothetical protein